MSKIRTVVYWTEQLFTAQCLEHDICVQADSIESLMEKLGRTITAEEVIGGGSLDIIPCAPKRFFDMWSASKHFSRISKGEPELEIRLCA